MRHSKFILKRIWLWDIWLHFNCFLCGRGCGCYRDTSHSPWLQRAPRFCELATSPQQQLDSPQAGGGRGGAADSGALGPHSHQEDTVPRENVSTKGHMAPFCLRPLDKGVGGGGGAARRHTSRGHWPHPSQTAGWLPPGRNGALFLLAGLPWCWAWGGLHLPQPDHRCAPPTFCSAPAGRANSSLSKPSEAEACETPQLSGLQFRMWVNLK